MSRLFQRTSRGVWFPLWTDAEEGRQAGVQEDSVVGALALRPAPGHWARITGILVLGVLCAGVPGLFGWAFLKARRPPIAAPVAAVREPDATSPSAAAPRPFTVSTAVGQRPVRERAEPRPASDAVGGDELRVALQFHRLGDFDNALRHYRAAIQQNGIDAAAHNNLGLLYQEHDLLDESARELRRAIEIDPTETAARTNYGVTLLRQGRLDQAFEQFREVLSTDPNNVDAIVNLALTEKAAGQPGRAAKSLLRALGLDPVNAAAHYNLAVLYDDAQPGCAVEHYGAFLESARGDFAADRVATVRARMAALQGTARSRGDRACAKEE